MVRQSPHRAKIARMKGGSLGEGGAVSLGPADVQTFARQDDAAEPHHLVEVLLVPGRGVAP